MAPIPVAGRPAWIGLNTVGIIGVHEDWLYDRSLGARAQADQAS